MNELLQEAKAMEETLIADRRYLHQHAEIGLHLPKTCAYVVKRLEEMGYTPQVIGESGVLATIGQGEKTFLLRGDMDALPITEESGLPFACTNGHAHACGHDFHTAMLLGCAKLLKNHEQGLKGVVKLMFQPAEETFQGAQMMVDAGILENPPVDAALAIHINSVSPVGQVSYKSGLGYASSSDGFEILIQGKGGHGAMPQTTVDPINIGAHLYLALQTIVSREVNPAETVVLSIGMIQAGNVNNVIPDTLKMTGTLRTYSDKVRQSVKERIITLSQQTAALFGGSAEVIFTNGTPAFIADEQLCDTIHHVLTEILPEEQISVIKDNLTGSEDFAVISQSVPAMMLNLGAAGSGDIYLSHHPKVVFNEEALHVGAAIYAYCAMAYLAQ